MKLFLSIGRFCPCIFMLPLLLLGQELFDILDSMGNLTDDITENDDNFSDNLATSDQGIRTDDTPGKVR